MKKSLILIAGAALTLMSPVAAFANTVSNSNAEKVWIAKDITQSSHYQIERKTLDSHGHVIGTQMITPPDGSMAEFDLVPLAQAQAQHLPYVLDNTDGIALAKALDGLHKQLFHSLNKNAPSAMSVSPNASPIPVGTSTVDEGTFNDATGTCKYDIYYNKPSSTQINVTEHDMWQDTGSTNSNYESYLMWGSLQWNFPGSTYLPYGSANATQTYPNWTNSTGQQFQTWVRGSGLFGTRYEGYDTLN